MGEIADALRRARSQRAAPVPAPAPADPGLRTVPAPGPRATSVPEPTPVPRAAPVPDPTPVPRTVPVPEPKSGLTISSVEPQNAAIVLEQGPEAEACRHLALRLRKAMDERRARSIAIVSAERGDGKTTVACNVAIALATLSREREVALVDLDLRKPAIVKSLSIPHNNGVEEALLGRAAFDSVRIAVQQPAIDVYPVVTPQDAAHELLVLPELAALIAELERRYATVVVDTPPAPLVPDATLILRHVTTCAPVVRVGKTRARSLRRLLDALPRERLIGWILNAERTTAFGYGDYYTYGEGPEVKRPWYLGGGAQ